jgi:hypothetical protein
MLEKSFHIPKMLHSKYTCGHDLLEPAAGLKNMPGRVHRKV